MYFLCLEITIVSQSFVSLYRIQRITKCTDKQKSQQELFEGGQEAFQKRENKYGFTK
jgi:hypothetical protein